MDKSKYLFRLDSLRGVAAVLVMILHFSAYLSPLLEKIIMSVTPFVHRSYLLVDMFFILSGFVMTLTYSKKFGENVLKKDYLSFMKKRFIKLYPLHILTFVFLVFLHRFLFVWLDLPADDFVLNRNNFHMMTNTFLLQSSGLGWGDCFNCSSWNYPSWSISVEWICYFFIPFVAFIIPKFKKLSFITILLGYILFYFYIEVPIGNTDVLTQRGIIRCFLGMCFGVWIFAHGYLKFKTPKLAFYAIVFGAFFSMHLIRIDTIVIILMGLMILLVANYEKRSFLDSNALIWLGKRSFSIYMIHVLVQDIVSGIVRYFYGHSTWKFDLNTQVVVFIASCVLVLVLSHISYLLIEKKLHRFLRKNLVK